MDLLAETLTEVKTIFVEERKTRALISLIPYVAEELLVEIKTMPGIRRQYNRALLLSALLIRLPVEQWESAIRDILRITHNIKNRDSRTEILRTLVSQLTANRSILEKQQVYEKVEEVLDAILEVLSSAGEKGIAEITEIMAPYLSENLAKKSLNFSFR